MHLSRTRRAIALLVCGVVVASFACGGSGAFTIARPVEQLPLQTDELPTGNAGNLYKQTDAHATDNGYMTAYESPTMVKIESTVSILPTKAEAVDFAHAASVELGKQGFTRAQEFKIGDLTTTGTHIADDNRSVSHVVIFTRDRVVSELLLNGSVVNIEQAVIMSKYVLANIDAKQPTPVISQ